MAEPIYGSTTEEMWERIPEHFHRMDALNDYAMKKYVNGMASRLQIVDDIVDRIDYDNVADGGEPGETSDLVDPNQADARWLPWLGQLFGTYIRGNGQESDRAAVVTAAAGFSAGTPAAIEAAAKDVLVGSKFVHVYKRSAAGGIGTGGPWDLLIVTIDSETLKNLYPEIQATVAETVSWSPAVTGTGTATKRIVKANKNVYQNSALEVGFENGTVTALTVASDHKVTPITPTDWYQAMITLWTNGPTRAGTFKIRYYNVSNAQIGEFSTSISITSEPQQFVVGGVAPASTTYAKVLFTVTSPTATDKYFVAQLAARHEINDHWIPKTADPVQAVIDKGAKPAGFILHSGSATSSWDDVLGENPTWADWEAAGSWEALEES